jgi:glycosyltransferase involved in cell wall biosynthesis
LGLELANSHIRVANIIEEGKLGGPQIRIVMVASAMREDVDTTVIMPFENSKMFRDQCNANGVKYKAMSISRITTEWRAALHYIIFSIFEIAKIVRFLKREKFDLVHVSGGSWQYKGAIAGRLAGIKILWHLNDTSMPLLFRKVFGLFSGYADGYIYASERTKTYYENYCDASKVWSVIPAPVNTKIFSPNVTEKLKNNILKKWQGKLVVGMVANINPIKGVDIFIEAAQFVNKSMSNVIFVIVGQVYKNQLNYYNKIKPSDKINNILFMGQCDDVSHYLQRFDIYVCSSHSESSPLSVWEAMSMEKPIVSTDVGDVPLYVKDESNGYIVPVNDSQALANRMIVLLGDPKMRVAFGRCSREIAVKELDITICSQRQMDAYQAVVLSCN